MSINNFYVKMTGIQEMLLGKRRSISEEDILKRIMLSIQMISEAKLKFHSAELRIVKEKLDLKAARLVIRTAEKFNLKVYVYKTSSFATNTSINAANLADNGS